VLVPMKGCLIRWSEHFSRSVSETRLQATSSEKQGLIENRPVAQLMRSREESPASRIRTAILTDIRNHDCKERQHTGGG
jgi:hypothetical protein